MDTQQFLSIALVGAIVSAITEYISRKFNVTGNSAKMVTILLSVLLGGAVVYLQQTTLWPSIAGVLGSASAIYALLLKDIKQQ